MELNYINEHRKEILKRKREGNLTAKKYQLATFSNYVETEQNKSLLKMAEEELNSMSKNARWSTRKRFAEGSIELGKIYGYDYSKGTLTINPAEAEVVRLIFKLFLEGKGTRQM